MQPKKHVLDRTVPTWEHEHNISSLKALDHQMGISDLSGAFNPEKKTPATLKTNTWSSPSAMKSAGKFLSNFSLFSKG